MEMSQEFEDTLTRIGAATSLNALTALLAPLRDSYGLAYIVYRVVDHPSSDAADPILLLTQEEEWIKRYTKKEYFLKNPVIRAGLKSFLPLDWSAIDRQCPDACQFFSEAAARGIGRQGMTIPIRGPAGERALFTVTADMSDREWADKHLLYMREFQTIAYFVHDRAMRLARCHRSTLDPNLSLREVQCLQKTAQGLAVKQIASQLSISTSAVKLYLQSARHKLACASVVEAAVKAVHQEIIFY